MFVGIIELTGSQSGFMDTSCQGFRCSMMGEGTNVLAGCPVRNHRSGT